MEIGIVLYIIGVALLIEGGLMVVPGACALTIGEPDWKLHFNPEKCIACKLCLKSCPLKLFRIEFAD